MSNTGYIVEPHFEYQYSLNSAELEEMVVMERLYLYNRSLPCSAGFIKERLEKCGIENVPSISTIKRILLKNDLVNW